MDPCSAVNTAQRQKVYPFVLKVRLVLLPPPTRLDVLFLGGAVVGPAVRRMPSSSTVHTSGH